MTRMLLDTTLLIDLSRGYQRAADFVEVHRDTNQELAVSVVSAMELIVGCRNKVEVGRARGLIDEFTMLPLTPAVSSQGYEWLLSYGTSHGLLIPDALIGATALVHGLELMTDNLKDFQMLPGLQVRRPY